MAVEVYKNLSDLLVQHIGLSQQISGKNSEIKKIAMKSSSKNLSFGVDV